MAIYSIFERKDDPEPRAVPDRFSWFATLLPPVYCLAHGLWWGLLGYVAAVAALVALSGVIGGDAALWLYIVLALLFGFEGATLRRVRLNRRRYGYAGELVATDELAAEAAWLSRK